MTSAAARLILLTLLALLGLLAGAACAPEPAPPPPAGDFAVEPARPVAPIPYPNSLTLPDDLRSPIAASLYVLPARTFDTAEAAAFLRGLRRMAPERALVVFSDQPLRSRLDADPELEAVHWLPSDGHALSPWPRDPLILARAADGGVLAIARPNAQRGREADQDLARLLVELLPVSLAQDWRARWTVGSQPFHNGQVLLAPEAAWLSLHALEERALELLGLRAVPVETFGTAAGIARYLEAVGRAADEAGRELYRRPVRFVHPLPDRGTEAERVALTYRIGGGAGFDLDSLVTLLPGPDAQRALTALVADVEEGGALLAAAANDELAAFADLYGLEASERSGGLRAALNTARLQPRARGLDGYLDLIAAHLAQEGLQVRRLPLLVVPTALLGDRLGVEHDEFLVGWNNVAVEQRGGETHAEGFASGLFSGDARAQAVFRKAGCALDLLPVLARSVVRNGGYRCASNHLRFEPGGRLHPP